MRYFILFFCLSLTSSVFSQVDDAWIEANSVRAMVKTNGLLFYNGFKVPKSAADPTVKTSVFRSVIPWIGGQDPGGNLKLAAGSLNAATSDFRAGIVRKPGYDKVWRVTKAEIVQHRADFSDNGVIDQPIQAIMEWPGSLSFDEDEDGVEEILRVAPFAEKNWNGVYDPEKGEHPAGTMGQLLPSLGLPDEILFFAFNDSTKHLYSKGDQLDIQIFCTVFAYDCPESDTLHNTVFVNFEFWNRGVERLDTLFFGLYLDFDIGNKSDDYIGSGSYGSLFYAYNGDDFDENGFLQDPPMAGVMTIRTPLNQFGDLTDARFIPIYSSPLGASFPQHPREFYNYLACRWRDGSPLRRGGSGYNPASSTPPVFQAFPDVPGAAGGWSEPTSGNAPSNRIAVLSHEPISLLPGGHNAMLTAFAWSRGIPPAPLSGYPSLVSSGQWIKEHYLSFIDPMPPMPACLSFTVGDSELASNQVLIYPNPAANVLSLNWSEGIVSAVRVFDFLGKPVFTTSVYSSATSLEILVRYWPAGFYFLQISDEQGRQTVRKVVVVH